MKRRAPKRPSSKSRDTQNDSSDDNDVGYGKPPKKHQFPPGKSGNPAGRPKGSKNSDTLLKEILDRRVTLTVGGKLSNISIREGILMRIAEDALKGNTKSAAFALGRYDAAAPAEEVDSEDDRQVIENFVARWVKNGSEE